MQKCLLAVATLCTILLAIAIPSSRPHMEKSNNLPEAKEQALAYGQKKVGGGGGVLQRIPPKAANPQPLPQKMG